MEEKLGSGMQSQHDSSQGNEESHTGVGAEMHARMNDQLGMISRLATQAREEQEDPSQSTKQPQEGEKSLSGLGTDTIAMMESLRNAALEDKNSESNVTQSEDAQRAEALQSAIKGLRSDQMEEEMPEHLQQEFTQVVEPPVAVSEKKGFFTKVFNSKFFSWFRRLFPKH